VATHNNRRESGLIAAAAMVRWWPAALAFVALGVAYALVSDRLTVGPPWWPLVLAVLAVAGTRALRWRGLIHATRYVVIPALMAVTIAVTISAGFLVDRLLRHTADPSDLLSGGALVWFSNILTFALWYWELDGGGPAHRHATRCGSSDFAFPQVVVGRGDSGTWMPEFVDYLFLAFNTSTAFSPTDTMVLARRAKIMMMCQSLVSLVAVLVLVARAINSL
jgi:uncharacterized membrane protein